MTYVFLGPSLSVEEAKKVCDAHYLPPVCLGEIAALVREKKPRIIALIDGYFSQTLPVWHKEILYALDAGVAVLGASSMGALRAAETDRFGMVGVGKIYELYRSQEINDDDEVALLHAPKESGYLNLSLPMVNIRFTLQAAAEKGLVNLETCKRWITLAKSLYYPDRTLDEIARLGGLTSEEITLLHTIFDAHYVNQKKEDALSLLRLIAEGKVMPGILKEPLEHSLFFQQMLEQDCPIGEGEERTTGRELVKYVAVHHSSFCWLRMQTLNRVLTEVLAEIFQIEITEEELEKEKERFKMTHALMLPPIFEQWLLENQLTHEEFDTLMQKRGKLQKLYLSQLGGTGWRLHKNILDELKLNNAYTEWKEKGATHTALWKKAAPHYIEVSHDEIFNNEIFSDHIQNSAWDLEVSVNQWCAEAGFYNIQELAMELHKAKLVRHAQQSSAH